MGKKLTHQEQIDTFLRYMDRIVEANKLFKILDDFGEGIILCSTANKEFIHIYRGLPIFADYFKKEIKMTRRKSGEYPFEFEIEVYHKGHKFNIYQIEEKEEDLR